MYKMTSRCAKCTDHKKYYVHMLLCNTSDGQMVDHGPPIVDE